MVLNVETLEVLFFPPSLFYAPPLFPFPFLRSWSRGAVDVGLSLNLIGKGSIMCREGNWKGMTELPDITWAAIASTVNIPLLVTALYSTPFIRSIPPFDAKGERTKEEKKGVES